jgi:prophage regulatory protein
MTAPEKSAPKLLDRKTVLDRVPLSYATIWKMMRDGKFPRSRDIGGKCAWLEHEIDKWIADRPKVQLKPPEAKGDTAA